MTVRLKLLSTLLLACTVGGARRRAQLADHVLVFHTISAAILCCTEALLAWPRLTLKSRVRAAIVDAAGFPDLAAVGCIAQAQAGRHAQQLGAWKQALLFVIITEEVGGAVGLAGVRVDSSPVWQQGLLGPVPQALNEIQASPALIAKC